MGEIEDSMINGELCQQCGEYMGEACGYPISCPSCVESEPQFPHKQPKPKAEKTNCKVCNKRVKKTGLKTDGDNKK